MIENYVQVAMVMRLASLAIAFFYFIYMMRTYRAETDIWAAIFYFMAFALTGHIGAKASAYMETLLSTGQIRSDLINEIGNRNSGAYLFCLVAFVIFRKSLDPYIMWVCFMSSLIGMWIVGKWSCFIIGDACYGKPTDMWTGIIVHGLVPSHVKVHPVTIYDSISVLLIFIFLSLLSQKIKNSELDIYIGFLVLSLYCFCVEFLRINPAIVIGLSLNQILYLIIFLFSFFKALSTLVMQPGSYKFSTKALDGI